MEPFFINPNDNINRQEDLAKQYIKYAHLEDDWHKSGIGKPLSFIDQSDHFDDYQKFLSDIKSREIDSY